jgi:hypothetical protein
MVGFQKQNEIPLSIFVPPLRWSDPLQGHASISGNLLELNPNCPHPEMAPISLPLSLPRVVDSEG